MKKLNWRIIIQGVIIFVVSGSLLVLMASGKRLKKDVNNNTRYRKIDAVELKVEVQGLHEKIDTVILHQVQDRVLQKLIWEEIKND